MPPTEDAPNNVLLAKLAGFSLHAATVCEAYQRSRLERQCRYITCPSIATKRLSTDGQSRVVYCYKQPFRDGSTHVVLEPLDFIARLAALVPRPQIDRFVIRASIWWTTPRMFVAGTLDIASTSEPSICCHFGK